ERTRRGVAEQAGPGDRGVPQQALTGSRGSGGAASRDRTAPAALVGLVRAQSRTGRGPGRATPPVRQRLRRGGVGGDDLPVMALVEGQVSQSLPAWRRRA